MKSGAYIELSESHRKFCNYTGSYSIMNFFDPLLAHLRSDDDSLKEDNPLARHSRLLSDAMVASGRVPASEELLRERLEKAGFVDVQSFTMRLPMGPWAKDKYEHYIDAP
jgi:hypothetical protein